jgi:uncharacterized membrane protein
MNTITNIGRIVFSIPFIAFGLMHFAFGSNMGGLVPSWLPGGVLWVYVTGAALVAGAAAIAANRLVAPAGYGIAALMAAFVLTVHVPGLGDPATQQMAMAGALKDLGLLGAALFISGTKAS